MKSQAKIIAALLAGAAIGAVVSLLFAPSSGSELREDITDYIDDVIKSAKNKVDETVGSIREYGNSMMERSKSKLKSVANDISNYKDGVAREPVNNVKSKIK